MSKKVKIGEQDFEIIDTKERMTVPDCFVFGGHKIGKGHGEAKFYVGQKKDTNFDFFSHLGNNCFFLKSDIVSYLEEVKEEYLHPTQHYVKKEDIPNEWDSFYEEAISLEGELIPFSLTPQNQIEGKRFYLNSKDKIYNFIRKISLPKITYLASQKLKKDNKVFYYFRLFVDYFDEDTSQETIEEEQIIQSQDIKNTEKEQIIRARKGQGLYRDRLLKECPYCPITMVTDERILIASHIKPWVKSDNIEKIDPKNGFLLTPTYDKLFDRGFISFKDDRTMMVSNWISPTNQNKLHIRDGIKIFNLPIEGREDYLEYHRSHIFKK